ncbi:MAG: hypothetical protein C5B49_14705 [Bdellovibrio sp.]|nr:MAG: hypothetical protein C5B49_14705 [Bdellovibrio sp.]
MFSNAFELECILAVKIIPPWRIYFESQILNDTKDFGSFCENDFTAFSKGTPPAIHNDAPVWAMMHQRRRPGRHTTVAALRRCRRHRLGLAAHAGAHGLIMSRPSSQGCPFSFIWVTGSSDLFRIDQLIIW